MPASTTLDELLALEPDGVFFSNGPGDPAAADFSVSVLQGVLEHRLPYFGICFGNQLFGRALGLPTYKLKYGHRGINQPVLDLTTGKVEVTAHNHGFAVGWPRPAERARNVPPRGKQRTLGEGENVRPSGRERPGRAAGGHTVRARRGHPRVPQRRRGRGPSAARPSGVQRPVPPGVGRRSARCELPVRPVRRADVRRDVNRRTTRRQFRAVCDVSRGRGGRGEAGGHRVGPRDRVRPDRDRPGVRVRLLRHPGLSGPQGGGHPGHLGQLQPGHDHDRSRDRRRDVRRADHPGRRRQGHREGAPRRAARDAGRADGPEHRRRPRPCGRAREVRRRADRSVHRGDRGRREPRRRSSASSSRSAARWPTA